MLCSALLAVAAIIHVVAFPAVTSLDAGRYSISRDNIYLIPGSRAGEVILRSGFDETAVSKVWVADRAISNTNYTSYTLQYEPSLKFMSYNDNAVGTKLLTDFTALPFYLQPFDSTAKRHRIIPATRNDIAVCGPAKDIYAKFCEVINIVPTLDSDDTDFWSFTLVTTPASAPAK